MKKQKRKLSVWRSIFFAAGFLGMIPLTGIAETVNPSVPTIVPRSVWTKAWFERYTKDHWKPGKSSKVLESDFHKPEIFIIHHTEKLKGSNSVEKVRNIYKFHALDRHWGDIGYNYIIDQKGRIYEGRRGGNGVVGAHTFNDGKEKNYNFETIGIAIIGNYNTETVPDAASESLKRLMGWLAYVNDIEFGDKEKILVPINRKKGQLKKNYQTLNTVIGHRDTDDTSCPGDNLYNALDEIETDAQAYKEQYQAAAYTKDGEKSFVFNKGKKEKNTANLPVQSIDKEWFFLLEAVKKWVRS